MKSNTQLPSLDHPRLILTADQVERIRRNIAQDADSLKNYQYLKAKTEKFLADPELKYEEIIRGAPSYSTYDFLNRIAALSLMWRLDGDRRLLRRAVDDLLIVCRYPDWLMADKRKNLYFLLTGPMVMAVSFAYDWLYHDLQEDERRAIRAGLMEKGWTPLLQSHRSGEKFPMKVHHNHATIPNCGLGIAALAFSESLPKGEYQEAMGDVLDSMRRVLKTLEPDGGYEEGTWYWRFGFGGFPLLIRSMKTALNDDAGLLKMPGVRETGYFPMMMMGSSGKFFNFADSPLSAWREDNGGADLILLLGSEFSNLHFVWFNHRMMQEPTAWTLIGDRPDLRRNPSLESLPLERLFRGDVPVCAFRSSWTEGPQDNSLYVAFKGGRATVNHGDMDAGSFVLDALGERWICDLGWDEPYPYVEGASYWETGPGERVGVITKSVRRVIIFLSSTPANRKGRMSRSRCPLKIFKGGPSPPRLSI